MRKFGLAAILTFVDKGATAAMGRIGRRAALLKKQFQGVGAGLSQMRRGMSSMAMAALPLAAGLGLAIKSGMKFEDAFAKVRALTVNLKDSIKKKLLPELEALAQSLGATTKFSAEQSANAMEELVRAGIPVVEVGAAVAGTLSAAAAEGIGLADAAKIVASNLNLFKLKAKDAGVVAGQLALISTRSAASITTMQEALKLAGASAARLANATLPETLSALGALFDIGVKNTQAGTTLRGTIVRLAKPTKEIASVFGGRAGLAKFLKENEFFSGKLSKTFTALARKLATIKDDGKRAAAAVKIFGVRAFGTAAAFDFTEKKLERFLETQRLLGKEVGQTAKKMAAELEKTLTGQITLATSALSALNIQIFKLVAPTTKTGIRSLTKTLGDLSLAIRVVRGEKFTRPEDIEAAKKLSKTMIEVATGIREGFAGAIETLRGFGRFVVSVGKLLGVNLGGEGAAGISRVITKLTVLTALFAPLALVVGGVTRLFGGLASTAIGAVRVVAGGLGGIFKGTRGLFGKLGKAGKLGEMATAQPVRVVNFHEMGGVGALGGRTSGAREIDLAQSRVASGLGRLKDRINNVSSRLGRAGLLGVALGLGFAFGTLINRLTGASTRIADAAHNFVTKIRDATLASFKAREADLRETVRGAETLNQLIGFAKRGVGVRTTAGGPREAVTRELARARLVATLQKQELTQKQVATVLTRLAPLLAKLPVAGGGAKPKPIRPAKDALVSAGGLLPVSAGDVVIDRASLAGAVVSQLGGGLAGQAGAGALGGGDPGRTSPAPAASSGPLRIEIPVEIDGRQIALAVAEIRLDELERGGASLAPGDRRMSFERGLAGSTL